jgi:hypothetical protein
MLVKVESQKLDVLGKWQSYNLVGSWRERMVGLSDRPLWKVLKKPSWGKQWGAAEGCETGNEMICEYLCSGGIKWGLIWKSTWKSGCSMGSTQW